MTDQPDPAARILAAVEVALGDQLTTTARAQALDHIRSILTEQAATAEAELATLRAVSRGYCPHCGRGDCAPTVHDWEQERARAEHAEAERDELRDEITATVARLADMAKSRAEQDGAELVRLRAKVAALEASYGKVAADALAHGGCHRKLLAQCQRAEQAEAAIARVRETAERWRYVHDRKQASEELRAALDQPKETPDA